MGLNIGLPRSLCSTTGHPIHGSWVKKSAVRWAQLHVNSYHYIVSGEDLSFNPDLLGLPQPRHSLNNDLFHLFGWISNILYLNFLLTLTLSLQCVFSLHFPVFIIERSFCHEIVLKESWRDSIEFFSTITFNIPLLSAIKHLWLYDVSLVVMNQSTLSKWQWIVWRQQKCSVIFWTAILNSLSIVYPSNEKPCLADNLKA